MARRLLRLVPWGLVGAALLGACGNGASGPGAVAGGGSSSAGDGSGQGTGTAGAIADGTGGGSASGATAGSGNAGSNGGSASSDDGGAPGGGGITGGLSGAGRTGGDGGGTGEGGHVVPWDGVCPNGAGPSMVEVADFCIDSTEVTRAKYQAWLDAAPDPASVWQHEYCDGNAEFLPDTACLAGPSACQGSKCDNHPAVCVDWCDAQAYCHAAGKRLCGKMDGGGYRGGDFRNQAGREQGQWYHACVDAVARTDTDYCNTTARNLMTTVAVGSLATCQTRAPEGVYDLSGNVWEYVDYCNVTDRARCAAFGGSYDSYYASCSADVQVLPDSAAPHIGFRCCAP